jgi:hypothetical protein
MLTAIVFQVGGPTSSICHPVFRHRSSGPVTAYDPEKRVRFGQRAAVPVDQHDGQAAMGSQDYRVNYLPAESATDMFGGNSNWRCPV